MVKHRSPDLTVFSDASLSKDRAGWGAWAKGDGREAVFMKGGCVPHKNTGVVELEGMTRALLHLEVTGYLRRDDLSIVLQMDSLWALQQLLIGMRDRSWPVKPKHANDCVVTMPSSSSDAVRNHIQIIQHLLRDTQVVYLKHVKGHKAGQHTRSAVNELCDELARKGRDLPTPTAL